MTFQPDHRPTVGVIGLGIIGTRVVHNLRKAGFEVRVWNRSHRDDPAFCDSPADLATQCTVIQTFVNEGPDLLRVIEAMLGQLTSRHILLNHATVSPEETLTAAAMVQEAGAHFLDAPFTGSRDAAQAGELVYYIGGSEQTLAAVRPVLESSSREIVTIGDIGQASIVKIATNLISAAQVEALAEALSLLKGHGVALHKLADALKLNAARSGVTDMKLPLMVSGDFEPRFSLQNMLKDMLLARQLAEQCQASIPAAEAFIQTAEELAHQGLGSRDFAVIAKKHALPPAAASDAKP